MFTPRFAPRVAARSVRTIGRQRAPILRRTNVRFQSTETTAPPSNHTGAVVGGVAGGLLVFLGGYGWYHMSGAKSMVNTASSTKAYFDRAFKKTQEAAPEPSQALQWLRETTVSYAALIPGAKGYVNAAFDDVDKIHEKHRDEVDSIVNDTYKELKEVSKGGATMGTVSEAWDVLQKAMQRISKLAGDAADDIIENHPELKEKVGGKLTDLKEMGKQYGPEAQKKVDETWTQVQDILKGGVGVGTIDQIRKLVQEKGEELKKYGDEAWQKGMEQAKPLLDKQPQLKEIFEKNKDKLLKGDLGQLWSKVQEASKSGNTDDLQDFVKQQVGKAGDKAGDMKKSGLDQLFGMIPGGNEIMPKLQKLQELSQKHGKEAEKLAKEAIDDIQKVLEEKVEKGEKLAKNAKEDAKK